MELEHHPVLAVPAADHAGHRGRHLGDDGCRGGRRGGVRTRCSVGLRGRRCRRDAWCLAGCAEVGPGLVRVGRLGPGTLRRGHSAWVDRLGERDRLDDGAGAVRVPGGSAGTACGGSAAGRGSGASGAARGGRPGDGPVRGLVGSSCGPVGGGHGGCHGGTRICVGVIHEAARSRGVPGRGRNGRRARGAADGLPVPRDRNSCSWLGARCRGGGGRGLSGGLAGDRAWSRPRRGLLRVGTVVPVVGARRRGTRLRRSRLLRRGEVPVEDGGEVRATGGLPVSAGLVTAPDVVGAGGRGDCRRGERAHAFSI